MGQVLGFCSAEIWGGEVVVGVFVELCMSQWLVKEEGWGRVVAEEKVLLLFLPVGKIGLGI